MKNFQTPAGEEIRKTEKKNKKKNVSLFLKLKIKIKEQKIVRMNLFRLYLKTCTDLIFYTLFAKTPDVIVNSSCHYISRFLL
jgi:hypothetical protein